MSPEHYDVTFNVNMRGLIFTVQKALPLMRAGASIVLTSSVAGVKGFERRRPRRYRLPFSKNCVRIGRFPYMEKNSGVWELIDLPRSALV
ncbi:SDR family oxidoreductase [Paraburkholderia oxyphila]|uniref:SDR family oxidoreductase n=1 Tax=Paraburkholderia oxyphila TaxID=614212 RepID=UPI000A03BC36|nr:SDR family oxidoreductase [Paraburkholderia oxyphila]